jgi:type IV secretory pathway ATPase VirB11/archaellum biosynthesis ATPase
MPVTPSTMKAADVMRLADRLTSSVTGNLIEQVAAIKAESRLAASVIRALLRHVNTSDLFMIHDDGTAADRGEPPR